jgi:hypothetical protein
MALTRNLLKGMGLTKEQEDSIIEEHLAVVDALKADVQKNQEAADSLATVQRELDELKQGGWEQKAKDFEKKFNDLVAENQTRADHQAKEAAYRDLLKSAGVSEKRLESVLKVSNVDGVELEGGKIKNADQLAETVKQEWADFITTTETNGANTATPPETAPTKTYTAVDIRNMTPAEINQNWDAVKASISRGDS